MSKINLFRFSQDWCIFCSCLFIISGIKSQLLFCAPTGNMAMLRGSTDLIQALLTLTTPASQLVSSNTIASIKVQSCMCSQLCRHRAARAARLFRHTSYVTQALDSSGCSQTGSSSGCSSGCSCGQRDAPRVVITCGRVEGRYGVYVECAVHKELLMPYISSFSCVVPTLCMLPDSWRKLLLTVCTTYSALWDLVPLLQNMLPHLYEYVNLFL